MRRVSRATKSTKNNAHQRLSGHNLLLTERHRAHSRYMTAASCMHLLVSSLVSASLWATSPTFLPGCEKERETEKVCVCLCGRDTLRERETKRGLREDVFTQRKYRPVKSETGIGLWMTVAKLCYQLDAASTSIVCLLREQQTLF